MSFIEIGDEESVACEWESNQLVIKNDNVDETRKWMDAFEIVFNNDEFSFSYRIGSYKDKLSTLRVRGSGYSFFLSDEIYDSDECEQKISDDEIFEKFFSDEEFQNDDIKINVKNIISIITSNAGERNSIAELLEDVLKIDGASSRRLNSDEPKLFCKDFQGLYDIHLTVKTNESKSISWKAIIDDPYEWTKDEIVYFIQEQYESGQLDLLLKQTDKPIEENKRSKKECQKKHREVSLDEVSKMTKQELEEYLKSL